MFMDVVGRRSWEQKSMMMQTGKNALSIHDVSMVPLVCVESYHLSCSPSKFLHLIKVVHLREDEMQVYDSLIVTAAFGAIDAPQKNGDLAQVHLLKVNAISNRIT